MTTESLPTRCRSATTGVSECHTACSVVSALDATSNLAATRRAEVWSVLDTVMDPELDQSVVQMKFVSALTIADGEVDIQFRLPTYWCSPNFAFIMASDMHAVVSALSWVSNVTVVLDEHMYADQINSGIAKRLSFSDTFGDEADGNLDDVRRIFLLKAFQRRQEAMLLVLKGLDYTPEALVAMTLRDLNALDLDTDAETARVRYLERRQVAGPHPSVATQASVGTQTSSPDSLAFVSTEGAPLNAQAFAAHLKTLRSVRVNAEFNGALCSGLLSARYEFDMTTPLKSQQEVNPFIAAPTSQTSER